jgi:hypothetical protein
MYILYIMYKHKTSYVPSLDPLRLLNLLTEFVSKDTEAKSFELQGGRQVLMSGNF